MITLPALHSFKKFSLSYEFIATLPNFIDRETKVMLKDITLENGKTLRGSYQVTFFSFKIRDTCNDILYCLNSQKNNLSFDVTPVLL